MMSCQSSCGRCAVGFAPEKIKILAPIDFPEDAELLFRENLSLSSRLY